MNQTLAGLRESLAQLGAIANDLDKQVPSASAVSVVRNRVAERLGLPDVPTAEEQEALQDLFRAWLQGSGEEPTANDWSRAPFVFFYGDPPLGDNPRFSARVGQLIAEEPYPRVVRRAVYAYLRDFDPAAPVTADLGRMIVHALSRHREGWSADWKERADGQFRLFEPAGLAERLATDVCAGGVAPRSLFRDLGLTTELITRCGLHPPVATALLVRLNAGFAERHVPPDGSLREILEFFRESERLRFPDLKAEIPDQLLRPFAQIGDPDDLTRNVLSAFFDRFYGDPRTAPHNWAGVGAPAVSVMKRWLVLKSLDLFFDVLSRTADPIWRYRRSFWLALYRHGLIDDAWPAFGKVAQQMVQGDQKMRERLHGFGELRQAIANQSVMVMKLRGFIVAEWSHSGACRIWDANDGRAPRLGRGDYFAGELRADCLHSQIHSSTMHGSWQADLSSWIALRTGVRVPLKELMVNTHA